VNANNFFAELKRRNVYKVAIAYAVVAWLLMQVASQIFPFFEIPNWAVRLVVLLLVIGFPVAMILAWAFELTPEGIKRTELAHAEPAKRAEHRLWIYIVLIGAALCIGLFFFGRYTVSRKQTESVELPTKSIAVLPFENLSEEKGNAYFADGIQDEILARLSKIADLKVISRTSTQKYKSAPDNLREIARQLGVSNILEGSVQKAADQVRVNVQLINALNDAHLWSDIYDRKLTDIFAVESDIAKMIADTLQAKLSGAEQTAIASRPTENSEAHQLYLKGRYFVAKRTGDDLKRAIDYYNQAIAKDPNYALAYAGLADSYALLHPYVGEPAAEVLPKARAAAEKALSIDNSLAEAHAALGQILLYELNSKEARREFERAIELNPNYAAAHYYLGFGVLVPLGQFGQGIAEVKRAIELDPFSLIMNENLGVSYGAARRYPEAIAQLHKTIELDPNFLPAHGQLGSALLLSGDFAGAIKEYEKVYEGAKAYGDIILRQCDGLMSLARAYALQGERERALQFRGQVQDLEQRRGGVYSAFNYALMYLALDDKNEAIDWLERSYQAKEISILYIKINPELDPLRGDPRFEALVQKVVGVEHK
jgi:TolB-like protein/Tfp pilus assembly protein PilF